MVALSELAEQQRNEAQRRFEVLRPHLEDGVALVDAASAAGIPARTVRHGLARFRAAGLPGLARVSRRDRDTRRQPSELVALVEGLALRRPRSSTAHIHRQAVRLADERGWPPPSYGTVRSIVVALDPGLVALAHDGPAGYRDRFELVFRREAAAANAIWQADHTQLDVMILDQKGRPARPWLTAILDDFSRAVAGYAVNLGAPSALQTALALRQAIWRKADPAWTVCGLPEVLYSDHGSDFKSHHLEQVSADLRIQLINSTAGVPQGRGKIERLFGTITTELLPELPGYLPPAGAGPASPPRLSLAELDAAIARWISADYHARPHSETKIAPLERWAAGGWLPRLPESLEQLDLLLLAVAKPRIVHRDGIRFAGLRYLDLPPPRTSASPSPSATTRATWPRSASFTRASSSVAPSAPSSPTRPSASASCKQPGPRAGASCAPRWRSAAASSTTTHRHPRRRRPHQQQRLSPPRAHRGYAATARTDANAPSAR